MIRSRLLGMVLALGGAVAFAGSAAAFGGFSGGHMGGGFGGGGMGGGFGGGHIGGGFGGGGLSAHPALGSSTPGAGASPGLQSGRSVAVTPGTQSLARSPGGGMGRGPGTGDPHAWHHHGWHGGGYYGYGLGLGYDDFGYDDGYYPYDGYGYDYGYNQGYDNGVQTGRSAAEAGGYCATPVKTCTLSRLHPVGEPCSCRVLGGRSGGHVTN